MYLLIKNPAYQALFFSLLTPLLVLILRPKSPDAAWLVATYTFVAFLVVNAGLVWFADHSWRYFFISLGFTLAYVALTALTMSGVLKVLQLKGSEEGAMAFLILIYQPVALLLVMLAKWIAAKF